MMPDALDLWVWLTLYASVAAGGWFIILTRPYNDKLWSIVIAVAFFLAFVLPAVWLVCVALVQEGRGLS